MNTRFSSGQLRKYFIMGSQNCHHDPLQLLESALSAGITSFQFREKGEGSLTGNDKLVLGRKMRAICARYGVPFIVNDDIELVEPLKADGIHVGQNDVPINELRQLFPDKVIGLSVSNKNELANSPIQLTDYLGAGPVFNTTTKSDAKQAVGIEWIKAIRNEYPDLPIVGIGGITINNAASVLEAGANGVAVISAITKAKDITEAVQYL
ncbi:thiamine phosphate synthase [Virgibacillus dakarensis]|uniref:Thiamine-phosphate synthase n=1 Tax=Lentibacillus populi TaxID=1827502 RepID=A0A9W5X5W2_9BACI|nr:MULTISPECIES: thiamine phosphate synthase [Bacillaceae]MBT2218265.1 thiamine phosphate synthase [Virgibacillus dakarensis]MTW84463.1 thiamine phosphate synthase [Virgibacillus dakarensis]GGB42698.1 thiamine-phosphate synthase [Lentibacillus populi]